ncbi:hypothetical protein CDL12_12272 [Handroanthus impetiginosus]|uniref:Uncharacterized protein n=1 Tax=Handroanthus impetiginosus TaxID=429701 RepID=A0A2G9HCA2_9LAMI|nr:hypothetical protein CDL12_12272 [Handroanthus impetiginosus]
MASSLISNQNFVFQFPSLSLNLPKHNVLNTCISSCSSSTQSASHLKLHRISRASSEDLSPELIDDSKFVPLNSEDPNSKIWSTLVNLPTMNLALLLLGFQLEETAKLLKELDGEFLEVIFCTEAMINRSLWEVVNMKQSNLEASKMMMFIDAFPESGLEPPVFAAFVPDGADKPLSELIEEIMGDHEMLSARQKS